MTECGTVTLEIGPVLAVLAGQALTLTGASLAAWNARRAARGNEALQHSQSHLRASIENLGSIDPALHKET